MPDLNRNRSISFLMMASRGGGAFLTPPFLFSTGEKRENAVSDFPKKRKAPVAPGGSVLLTCSARVSDGFASASNCASRANSLASLGCARNARCGSCAALAPRFRERACLPDARLGGWELAAFFRALRAERLDGADAPLRASLPSVVILSEAKNLFSVGSTTQKILRRYAPQNDKQGARVPNQHSSQEDARGRRGWVDERCRGSMSERGSANRGYAYRQQRAPVESALPLFWAPHGFLGPQP